MQSHMQSNKCNKMQNKMHSPRFTRMQSFMQSNKEMQAACHDMQSNMQGETALSKSPDIRRFYRAKSKGEEACHRESRKEYKLLPTKEKDTKCFDVHTPLNIDLPSYATECEAANISQPFLYDGDMNAPLKNKVSNLNSTHESASNFAKAGDDNAFKLDNSIYVLQGIHALSKPLSKIHEGFEVRESDFMYEEEVEIKGPTGSPLKKRNTFLNGGEEIRNHDRIKRPQHLVLGFMEDHAEFGSDWTEASKCRGRYMSSVLESTVDGSIIKGARRLNGSRRMTSAELTSCIDSAIEAGDVDKDPLNVLDDWGLKTEFHKYKCSDCEEVSHQRIDIEQHIADFPDTHHEAVVVVLLGNKAQGRTCSLCNIRFQRKEYFKHIREKHKEAFPLQCGMCGFQGQDYNQMQQHIQKKHKTRKYDIIYKLQSNKEMNETECKKPPCELESESDDEKESTSMQTFVCPVCGRILKSLRILKKHLMMHSQQKQQCDLCSFTTNFPTQIRNHFRRKHPTETPKWKKVTVDAEGGDTLVEDLTPYLEKISAKYGVRKPKEAKWVRQYKCPHCDYTCNFNSSYNRHLRIHKGMKPFKCGYCDLHARESYLISRHIVKVHKGKEIIIENDKDFREPYRYAKNLKKEKLEWDEDVEEEIKAPTVNLCKDKIHQDLSPKQAEELKEPDTPNCKLNNEQQLESVTNNAASCKLVNTPGKKAGTGWSEETNANTDATPGTEKAPIESIVLSDHSDIRNTEPKVTEIMANDLITHVVELEKRDTSIFGEKSEDTPEPLITKGYSAEQVNQTLQINETLVNTSQNYSNTIKVKTFRDGENSIEMNLVDQNKSEMCSTNYITESLPTTNSITACIIAETNPHDSSDSVEKPLVIQLYADDNNDDNCTIKSVKSYSTQENLDKKVHEGSDIKSTVQLSDTMNNGNMPEPPSNKNEILEPKHYQYQNSISISKADNNLAKNMSKVEKSSNIIAEKLPDKTTNPPQDGLENTLHNHISFLSDSLAHRLSNSIPANSGIIMTRDLLELDYSNSDYFSSERVRMMMKKKGNRVKCSECGVTTTRRAFYKHAKKHFNVKPFKCGYCTYRSIEKSKIRVHNAFCHATKPCIILKLSPETAGVESDDISCSIKPTLILNTTGTEDKNKIGDVEEPKNFQPEIKENTKKGKAQPTTTSIPGKETSFECPICHKTLKIHSPSIRRHLYSHYSYKPYKCGYCAFTAIGQTEIRAHHVKHGSRNPPKVEDSGAPMPLGLAEYIEELLSQQCGSRRIQKKREQSDQPNEAKSPSDIMWHEPDVSREDLTAMYLSTDPSQQGLVTDDQPELEGLEGCSLQQSLDPVELNAETTYAVQVLKTESQASDDFSGELTRQLDLNMGPNTDSDVTGDPVCVLYFVE